MDERSLIDSLIEGVNENEAISIPHSLEKSLKSWKWGSYGWVSPASLIITSAWRKYLYPEADCCKIWAVDEDNKPIQGGYSIRSADESVTIPMLAKHDLCKGFCSPNSGMQGSRAIEKMRGLKRLNRNFSQAQRTVFDLKLFAAILNDINELNSAQAREVFRYLIRVAKTIRRKRIEIDSKITNIENSAFDPWAFLAETSDPELTKCYVAACFEAIYKANGLAVDGVSDHRTAADARAKKPGDISLSKNDKCITAIEVKDKSQNIDWQNIDRAKNVISNNPQIEYFLFVLESSAAASSANVNEIVSSSTMEFYPANKICISALKPIYMQALALVGTSEIAKRIGKCISDAPDVKPETKSKWLKSVSN